LRLGDWRRKHFPMEETSQKKLFLAVFPSVMLPMFLATLDTTIVSTAIPAIAGDLGDVERVSWIVVSYLIAATIAAPVYGRLGDALGRKRVMFLALGVFILASVLCAMSRSIMALSAARVLQGLGGGGLVTLSQALVGEVVPPRERGRYQGYTATTVVCSSSLGPVVGGWLTQYFNWQTVFWVNVPLGLLAVLLTFRLKPRLPSAGAFNFDFAGLALFILAVVPLLLAIEQFQKFDPTLLPFAVLMLGISATAVVLLLRQQALAKSPLLPIALLRQEVIWRCNLMAVCTGATIVSLVTFLPIYLEVVRALSPAEAGMHLLPLTAFVAVGSIITGQIITRTGHCGRVPSVGQPVLAVLMLAFAILAPSLSLAQLPIFFFGIALTLGTSMPVVQVVVQLVAGVRQLGAAAGSVQFFRSVGAGLGAAVVGAVLFGSLAAFDTDTARLFAHMVEVGPKALDGLSPERVAVVQAQVANAFRAAFAVIAIFPMVAAYNAWKMPVRRIDNFTPPPAKSV
jgi:EmrB/QacA subfamily drug resistance transporter